MNEHLNYKDSKKSSDYTCRENHSNSKTNQALGSIYITEPFAVIFQPGGKYLQIPFNAFLFEPINITVDFPNIKIMEEGFYEIQLNMIVLFPSIEETTLLSLFAGPLNGTISVNGSPITEGIFFFGQLSTKLPIRIPFFKSIITKLYKGDKIEVLVTSFTTEEIVIEKSTLSIVKIS
ncbi:MAG: hypothetical protein KID00_01805 [Clostridium argentinense]|uniref:Uncharacterized protein n=1 Tax=Clostridium faecium TaxID=2762223 RepID=A0ABR8YNG7_9CLOT|nr:hypothetical protein [Clostridium faecium]MBD8045790.1 hypothetical protein [Clostridium faecium]MBS5822592.1 hypothetical protein [Clostridium argentinense]MDU1347843.1 hypothetical protein [Clostridium argentinense]